ncbi:DUF4376 domain-containing protein [Pseudoalteromonas aurantia]|uniref:DUF4376 domain-containing protein n=1 Tax=Pseudoalteromonas aurantia 208 TaxID=1314867 RepID=A0ABR9E9I8_9GAMM|nr:hypothetical protein [Pseudoalteromonas aurantia]MBE0367645.1 hypothetical protein [Pseudoalteromonas aurantia 208]
MELNDQSSANKADIAASTSEQAVVVEAAEATAQYVSPLDSANSRDESENEEVPLAQVTYENVLTKMALRHPQSQIDNALKQAIAYEQAKHVAAYQQWELEVVIAQAKRDDALAHNATITAAESMAESTAESSAENNGVEAALVEVPELPQQPRIDMTLRRSCYRTEYVEVDLELTTQTQVQRKEYDDEAHVLRIYPATQAHSAEYIAQVQRARFKASRALKVAQQTVIVEGMEFDADEMSQQRMARALLLMEDAHTTRWVLANNDVVQVSKKQLFDACKLAGEQQSALWVPAS